MQPLSDLLKRQLYDDAAKFEIVAISEADCAHEMVRQLFHPAITITHQHVAAATKFYRDFALFKLNRAVFVSVTPRKQPIIHCPFEETVPFQHILLAAQAQQPKEGIQALVELKFVIMRHVTEFDLFADPFYTNALLSTHYMIYYQLLLNKSYREAMNQLQIIHQLSPDPHDCIQQHFRLLTHLGFKVPVPDGDPRDKLVNELLSSLFTDGEPEQPAQKIEAALITLNKKLLEFAGDKEVQSIIRGNMALLKISLGHVNEAKTLLDEGKIEQPVAREIQALLAKFQ